MQTPKDFTNEGYRKYKVHIEAPLTHKAHWQKKVDSAVVCELNEALHINIYEWGFEFQDTLSYDISIVAQIKGDWYKLQAYSISSDTIDTKLKQFEDTLVKMINGI